MAFQKKTWLARLGQGLNKFIFNGGSKVTLDSSPDVVTQEGTPLSADNMNDLEQRIEDEFTNVNGAITSLIKTVSLDLTTDSGGFAFYEFDAPIRILSVFVKGRNGTNVNGWMAGFSTFSPDLTYKKYYFTIYDNVGSSFGAKDITIDVTYQDIAQS